MATDTGRATGATDEQVEEQEVEDEEVDEHFLNFGFEPSINNRRFIAPAAPPLTQPASEAALVPCLVLAAVSARRALH